MGTYNKGILGPFSGTVGSVVGASYRGKDVMRSRPRKSSKPATEIQKEQRAKFSKTIKFLTPVKVLVSEYFGSPSGAKSRFNLAVSYHIQTAVEVAGEEAVILYDKVVYAKGTLLAPQNLQCEAIEDHQLKLTWINNSAQADTKPNDKLMLVVVEKEVDDCELFLNVAERSQESVNIQLPAYLVGASVHVYEIGRAHV